MKKEKKNPGKLPAWLTDPRLELPLRILVIGLSLFLAGLILVSTAKNYVNYLNARTAPVEEREEPVEVESMEEESFRIRWEPMNTAEPFAVTDPVYGWQREGDKIYYVNQDGRCLTGLHLVDGRWYYFAPDGTKASALGVDVSYYNEDVNWSAVRAQGIDFAIVRVGGRGWTYGVIYHDLRCRQYLHNARAAGLRVGVYFYSTAGSEREAAEEARTVLRVLDGQPLDLPVFIDVEESGEYPAGRVDRLSREARTKVIEAFCREIETGGYEAGIYSGQYFFNTQLYVKSLGERMIWIANYSAIERGQVPGFGAGYEIWQFTDRGKVKGITGYTDMNVIF